MKTSLIVLDGARGSGKSTVAKILHEKLDNCAIVGMDTIRNFISNSKATEDYNKIAYEGMLALTNSFVSNDVTVIIDSGLTQERVDELKKLAKSLNANIFLFHLEAGREMLWDRVHKRGNERGVTPNRERFDYTFDIQRAKDFNDFYEIHTENLTPEEVAGVILDEIE